MVLVLIRGDHRLNEIKLRNALGADFRQASAEEIEAELGPVGFIGPVGAERPRPQGRGDRRRLLRHRRQPAPTPTCAACGPAATSSSRSWTCARSRPATPLRAAARSRSSRRSRSATSSSSAPATRSRWARPTSTRTGASRPIVMGSYGIGPARIAAAAIEQGADEQGHRLAAPRSRPGRSIWSRSRRPGRRSARPPTASTRSCARRLGDEVLYDDRDAGPGEKLTDAELLGCPLRIVVGRRGLAEGVVEASERAERRRAQAARGGCRRAGAGAPPGPRWPDTRPPSAAAASAASSGSTAAARRRDRRAKGEPLNPWTIPNFVGYARLAGDPALPLPRLRIGRRALAPARRSSSG